MRVIDTLTEEQKRDLILGYGAPLLFQEIFRGILSSNYGLEIAKEFYLSRSSKKTISPAFELWHSWITKDEQGEQEASNSYASLIRAKYSHIWSKAYDYLIANEYNALNTIDVIENIDRNDTRNISYGKIVDLSGSNTENGRENVGTHEEVTTINNSDDSVFGFNSETPVGTEQNIASETTITEGDSVRNRTDTENRRTNASKESNSGEDNHSYEIDETKTKTGRYGTTPQSLIENELNMRSKYILFDIILRDLDREFTLPIYI